MPVVLNRDVSLTFQFDSVAVECQLQNPELTRPYYDIADTVTVACGDDVPVEADSITNGQIAGTVFGDYGASGITTLMNENLGKTVDIVWTETVEEDADAGATYTITWTGKGFVRPIGREFRAGQRTAHDIDIVLVSETSWERTEA